MATTPPAAPNWVSASFPDIQNIAMFTSGGQKTVFTADHPVEGKIVLKIIDARQDLNLTEREILAVASVQSPRVPAIYDHGTVVTPFGDCKWIRERFIDGSSLRDVLRTRRLTFDEVRKLARHVLEAAISSETVSIVHRDIKPENIICDTNGDYWLIDFGIARHLTLSSLTATGAMWGRLTLGYAPKEQMRNEKLEIDSRADLFALGITIIESYTGNHPFREGAISDLEIVKRVEGLSVPNPFLGNQLEIEFGDLVCTMLQKRRDLRPRNASTTLSVVD